MMVVDPQGFVDAAWCCLGPALRQRALRSYTTSSASTTAVSAPPPPKDVRTFDACLAAMRVQPHQFQIIELHCSLLSIGFS
jgi:hypothetical protein